MPLRTLGAISLISPDQHYFDWYFPGSAKNRWPISREAQYVNIYNHNQIGVKNKVAGNLCTVVFFSAKLTI